MQLEKSYEPADVERRWYAAWEEGGYFRPEVARNPDAPAFVMVIPPPNLTGSPTGARAQCNLPDVHALPPSRDAPPLGAWHGHSGIATHVVVERHCPGRGRRRHGP